MTVFLNTALSSLDTPTSLMPFFIKDAFDNTGRTIMAAKEGGKHEAREKFIEETGTSMFWIGGIPAVRWMSNKIFKNKIDTDIHFKRINSDGIQNYYADHLVDSSKNQTVKKPKFSKQDLEGIELGGENLSKIKEKLSKSGYKPNISKGKYKSFHVGTSIAAVGINFVMLTYALPKFNQWLSRQIIFDEVQQAKKQEHNKQIKIKEGQQPKPQESKIKKPDGKDQSFGSLKDLFDFKSLLNFTKVAETSQLNPTNSMLLLDYGISGSRVTFIPRDNNERIEYAVKEGGIILFFYQAADYIKKGFETIANKGFKTPIDLDYKIIGDKEFQSTLKSFPDKKQLLTFTDKKDELGVIKFIDKELANAPKDPKLDKKDVLKNFTLQMAHKEGTLDIEFDKSLGKWIRHSKKYIDTDKVVALNDNMKNFLDKSFGEDKKIIPADKVDHILKKTKQAKALSIIGNIAICCVSLSFLLPKLQYLIREKRTKTSEAPGIKVYKDMAEQMKAKGSK